MALPLKMSDLVERFDKNYDAYKGQNYNETRVRIEFIDPFFKELGWDMDNTQGFAETYKDVIHENAIKVQGATKAPDYSFRIGGQRKFFLEAKKPAVNVHDNVEPAYQLRRYGWNAGLPLSILTDFEEFAIYDTTIKPAENDKASTARIFYCTFREYAQHWDYISSIFSKDAILKGSFDEYTNNAKKKRGTTPVDREFLKEMEIWRDMLARNIAHRNTLSIQSLNFIVQATIDRILFLRISEERAIEEYGHLQKISEKPNIYQNLKLLFQSADEKYNSGLFHFRKEKDRNTSPDELSLGIEIDDKILKQIISTLYYPAQYEFSVIPADILGNVYEQFLGKVIRLTPYGQAKIEEKPDVRKAGGVYYTPQYIVKYIVENTVGEFLKGKTPLIVAGKVKGHSPLRILDPACGSGSFLIYAYQYLLDWHRDWYAKDIKTKRKAQEKKWQDAIYQGAGGQWFLTTREKKSILTNNIFGVDIDHQAVEVTKLNLLLKVLEGENQETIGTNLRLFNERALPDLAENIKCGNSLIGSDFYSFSAKEKSKSKDAKTETFIEISNEERQRINAFDWEVEFPQIFKAGGFDAVIGNPPYVFTRNDGFSPLEKAYYYHKFFHQSSQLNTFSLFTERVERFLKDSGFLGFIIPNNWLTIATFSRFRKFLLTNFGNITIINILDKVFEAADVDTAITLLQKIKQKSIFIAEMQKQKIHNHFKVKHSEIREPDYIIQISLLKDKKAQAILKKMHDNSIRLGTIATVSTGLKAYQIGKGNPRQTQKEKKDRVYHSKEPANKSFGKYLNGVDVHRYQLRWSGTYLSYGDWLAEPRKSVPFDGERILVRQIPAKPPYMVMGVLVEELYYNDINSMIIFSSTNSYSLYFLLGIINSRLLSFWFQKVYDKMQRKIFPQFKVKELGAFPIYQYNTMNKEKQALVRNIEKNAKAIQKQKNLMLNTKTPYEITQIQRQIDATDREIDQLVYELYGLTEEEIKIVERA